MNRIEKIERLLNPRAIAVVGASQAPQKLGGQLIPALIEGGYRGKIYPVNPRYKEVAGLRCFPSVESIPDQIDHCVIVIGKDRVPQVLADCRAKNVAGASIYTAGYAEVSEAGQDAQQALNDLAQDMVFIGPNCMGFSNLVERVMAAPSAVFRRASTVGEVALLSQSGGLAYATIAYFAQREGLDFSHVVNTGNSAGISYGDLIEYMFEDRATKVILVVTEGERPAGEVIDAVRRLGLRKPIVLLKLGRGQTGTRMALSHTGSLAGDFHLVRDLAEQYGIVCASDVDDALGSCELLRYGITGENANGLASLCISGGNITLFADQADAHGLSFAALSEATEARLTSVLPDYISVHNPIDMTAFGYENPSLHADVLNVLLTDPAVRTVVPIITTADDYTEVCAILADVKETSKCDMVVLWSGGTYETRSREILRQAHIPIFHSATLLANCLSLLHRSRFQRPAAAAPLPNAGSKSAVHPWSEGRSLAWLRDNDVSVPSFEPCHRDALMNIANGIGFPIVVKADSTDTHISDRDGVILNIRNEAELMRELPRINAWESDQVLVMRYMPGNEIVAGTFVHSELGPVLMVGSGGKWVELVRDVRFVGLPATNDELERAFSTTLVGRALKGKFRGEGGYEEGVEFLSKLAAAAYRHLETIDQIELNPVTISKFGAVAVDAAIYVKD